MIAELEQEKRRSAQVSAHCDDFTSLLQTERDKLLQQVWGKKRKVKLLTNEHMDVSASLPLPVCQWKL